MVLQPFVEGAGSGTPSPRGGCWVTAFAAGAAAAGFDALTVSCEPELEPAIELAGGLMAPGAVEVAGSRIVAGAKTGRA